MAQGSRTPRSRGSSQIVNLDDELIARRLATPQKVFLFAQEWTVRRDLDGAEIVEFWQHIDASAAGPAMQLLLGLDEDAAKEFAAKLLALPVAVYQRVFTRLLHEAGIRRDVEPADSTGKSTAS